MDNLMNKFESFLMPIAEKITGNRYLSAIKEGFFGATPILIAGSIFLLFTSIPIDGYAEFMEKTFSSNWMDFFYVPYQASFKLMAVFVVIGAAKSLAEYYEVDVKLAAALTLVGIFILTPIIVTEAGVKGLPIDNLSAAGLFVCLIVTFISVEIYRYCVHRGFTIKMPESVPQNVSTAFAAVIPAFIIIMLFNVIRLVFSLTDYASAQAFIFDILQQPLQSLGGTLPATVLVLLLESVIWCFGLHGSSIVSSVMNPIWYAQSAENLAATEAGLALPNIVNYQFIAHFVKIGGVGATLGLSILCLFRAKSEQYKALGKLSIGASIFNINEPVIFGFPIILNPMMMIPFVLSNILVGVVTYLAISSGLVPMINGVNLPYTLPVIISGFMLCGVQGAILQVVLLAMTTAIYFPFFTVQDRQVYQRELENKKEKELESKKDLELETQS
ncbi:PTS sugar transporter subunit IIC [Breznakia pachnodae]|uniref:Permease IIC component n=1 Tax=Breznakia pachnodae TaxID=265178 RepID=A0ABU0E8T2_9FIRM|nr:PTS sugar transporter subunit IIC [Breznakia pachnodae]MDQ0363277.1 PTS system cellobiose-specific IIC component [Breznakia pachnodae]